MGWCVVEKKKARDATNGKDIYEAKREADFL